MCGVRDQYDLDVLAVSLTQDLLHCTALTVMQHVRHQKYVSPTRHPLHCTAADGDVPCDISLGPYVIPCSDLLKIFKIMRVRITIHSASLSLVLSSLPSTLSQLYLALTALITVVRYATITFMNMQISADDALNEAYRQAPNVLPKLSEWIASSTAQADDIVAFINSMPCLLHAKLHLTWTPSVIEFLMVGPHDLGSGRVNHAWDMRRECGYFLLEKGVDTNKTCTASMTTHQHEWSWTPCITFLVSASDVKPKSQQEVRV
ncbi:hypothetical protein C8F04DRAFT_1193648 [Mycena alexandri]|uniref:Uncharacterized protein n=1 Tax=Mycena alexandri TaxID=1745969 RepID=A0AAD6SAL6_9AGAR|nr:hypothetical protein C8F04DRAFT_1193648 [Mycena alexandri]